MFVSYDMVELYLSMVFQQIVDALIRTHLCTFLFFVLIQFSLHVLKIEISTFIIPW